MKEGPDEGMPEEEGDCSPLHTRGKPVLPGKEAQGRNPLWLLPQRVGGRNQRLKPAEPEWPGERPGGGASPPNKEPRSWGGEPGPGHGSSKSREKGKGLRTVCRLDGAQGLGPPGRQNTLGGWRGASAPPSPPTRQTGRASQARCADAGAVGAGASSPLGLGFPNPPPLPPRVPSPSTAAKAQLILVPKPCRALAPFVHPGQLLGSTNVTTSLPSYKLCADSCLPAALPTLAPAKRQARPSSFQTEHLPWAKHCAGTAWPWWTCPDRPGHLLAFVCALPLSCTPPPGEPGSLRASAALGVPIPTPITATLTDDVHRHTVKIRQLDHSAWC